jgi:hypothetical protein
VLAIGALSASIVIPYHRGFATLKRFRAQFQSKKKKLRFARKFRKNNRFVDQRGVNSKASEGALLAFRDKLPYHFYLDCSGRHGNEISRRV